MCRLGGLAMVNCPLVSKDLQVRWIGHGKCVGLREYGGLSLFKILFGELVQNQWAKWPPSAL